MKLFVLQLGLLQPLRIPVPGYLIQTAEGENILVDSGFPESYIHDPPGPLGPLELRAEVRPEDHVVARLAELGLAPRDIDFVVCTHFDADHAGNHDLFQNAELVVQRQHYDAAKSGDARSAVVRQHWEAPGLRYRLVDGDTTLVPGVDLVETSGHVPGHQSVLVWLPRTGPVLLAVDAVPAAALFDADKRPILPNDEDAEETRASTRKLAASSSAKRSPSSFTATMRNSGRR